MIEDKSVRTDIEAALVSVLIVFSAIICIPMLNVLLTVVNAFETGSFPGSPALAMTATFLLAIEVMLVSFIVYTAYRLIRTDRRWGARHEPH